MDPLEIARQLGGMTGAQLRATLADVDAELTILHYDERGQLRQLSDDEQGRFGALIDLRAKARQHAEIRAAYDRGGMQTAYQGLPAGRPEPTTVRGQALRALERAEGAPDHARHRMAGLLDRADGPELDLAAQWTQATIAPAYERAVAKVFRDPVTGHREFDGEELAAWQQAKTVQRAMSLTDASGGFLLPFVLDPNIIISSAGSVNPLRQLARIETTVTDQWAGVTSAGVTASWRAEAAETTDASPTLVQPNIAVHKADAFVVASIEVAADARIGEALAPLFTDAKDQLEATAQTTGSGSGQPKGIITALVAAGGSVVIATATNVLAQGDLYANQAALPARWRPRARFSMNLSILNGYRQLPQATGLNYSIINDDGPRPKALGWEVFENSSMDGTLGAGADYTVLSGEFRQFCIVDRIGAQVEFIPHLFGPTNRLPTGQRGWYMYWRTGSDVLVADAFRLTNHST
jgi:HK97 family phage major capsid protein